MKGFMNPIFRPVDNDIPVETRNNIEVTKENFNIPEDLPKEYDKIFSSITDSSQNLGDSLLQPFDNSKFMPILVSQDSQNQQHGQLFQVKCQQHIVKFDRNRLQNILKILANQQQTQAKNKPKEQLIQDPKQIISENRQQVQKKQTFNMPHFAKNDTSPKDVQTFFKKLDHQKSPKQRSSTNYTPRLDDQQNLIKPHSYKNLDANTKNDYKHKFYNLQKRTCSEYFTKYVSKFQTDRINLKLKELKTQFDSNSKVSNQLQLYNLIEKIIDQNLNLEKLRQDIIQLSECCLQINQKSQNFQYLQKLTNLANEKYKTLQTQILGLEETSSLDIIDKKQVNGKLSRQTTSDNIFDELNEEKKKFYVIVVNLKLELPFNHPGKNLLLCELFNKAQKLGIKKPNWENFIKNEMKF